MTDPKLKLDKARWWALREQPFYGSLAMGLTDHIDQATPTACTDGRSIRWGSEFLGGLTDEETRYILLHEALHCAHGHLWRLPADKTGNEAGDYQIEHILRDIPGISMPEGGLICPSEFEQLAEEEIYARLASKPQDGQSGTGQGDSLRDHWERRVSQAAHAAQAAGQGSVPGDMARALEKLAANPVDWRQEMAEFVRDAMAHRNDWSRSARRHAWQSVIYPRRRTDDIGLVVFARDTSGSVNDQVCAEFSALISSALADCGCRGLVLDCDAAIQQEIELAPGEECPTKAKGGGGTDFRPVFERAAALTEEGERIAGIVYLTDLRGTFPEQTPDIATLWVATTGKTAPFGRTVNV